jgi:predicted RNase H-like HicB family nuclease
MGRRKVWIEYHSEPEGWWAESPDLPGFSAAGDTFPEVHAQAHEGAEFFAEEPLEIEDLVPTTLGPRNTAAASGLVARVSMATLGGQPVAVIVSFVRGAGVPAVATPGRVNVHGLDQVPV